MAISMIPSGFFASLVFGGNTSPIDTSIPMGGLQYAQAMRTVEAYKGPSGKEGMLSSPLFRYSTTGGRESGVPIQLLRVLDGRDGGERVVEAGIQLFAAGGGGAGWAGNIEAASVGELSDQISPKKNFFPLFF